MRGADLRKIEATSSFLHKPSFNRAIIDYSTELPNSFKTDKHPFKIEAALDRGMRYFDESGEEIKNHDQAIAHYKNSRGEIAKIACGKYYDFSETKMNYASVLPEFDTRAERVLASTATGAAAGGTATYLKRSSVVAFVDQRKTNNLRQMIALSAGQGPAEQASLLTELKARTFNVDLQDIGRVIEAEGIEELDKFRKSSLKDAIDGFIDFFDAQAKLKAESRFKYASDYVQYASDYVQYAHNIPHVDGFILKRRIKINHERFKALIQEVLGNKAPHTLSSQQKTLIAKNLVELLKNTGPVDRRVIYHATTDLYRMTQYYRNLNLQGPGLVVDALAKELDVELPEKKPSRAVLRATTRAAYERGLSATRKHPVKLGAGAGGLLGGVIGIGLDMLLFPPEANAAASGEIGARMISNASTLLYSTDHPGLVCSAFANDLTSAELFINFYEKFETEMPLQCEPSK